MPSIKLLGAVGAAVAALGLQACSTTLGVHPDYVSAGVAAPTTTGSGTLVMDAQSRSQTFAGGPQSLTGAATTVSIPIGEVIASVGEKVCSPYFAGGVRVADQAQSGSYTITVESQGFSYKYDQLSNLGFAITPKVTLALKVGVGGPDGGEVVAVKRYERTDFSASGPYFVSLNAPEKINQSLHMAAADIFREVMAQLPKK